MSFRTSLKRHFATIHGSALSNLGTEITMMYIRRAGKRVRSVI
jgi:hypothetical protein